MQLMEMQPHQFILHHSEKELKNLLQFKHRTFNTTDLLYFIEFLKYHYSKHNSLEDAFSKWMSAKDETIEKALIGFHHYFFSIEDVPARTKKHIATRETALNQKKGELEKIISDTEKEEKHFSKLSGAAREGIDERLLYSYDRIRKSYRNGLAVVPVLRDACGGCFNSIPPQRQSEIRQHKKIIVCENCGRILVDEDLNTATGVK